MPRLIPLPDKDGRPGDSRLWINPNHIVTAAPIISRTQNKRGDVLVVAVELKLEGVPTMRAWLGEATGQAGAETIWQGFLDQVLGRPQEL
ncbi:hypothetical protein EDF46_3574 [Frondihabitans sp. PhB188]|uniref:hypothetical protein n=1 Tax=Frondihabitans sp. PhB188 TaxID=2485200 RepID=UPI000F461222|nr:hypothetical protein [Frondihabitans sp. PhB188]ROQ30261.1 hypothetical protein EDF46_3574 [Frondihabitans sp. PhB188]